MPVYSDISLWMSDCGEHHPRPALQGQHNYDVAIVGGGYTGLWTAWYLKHYAPELSVCVLEAHICGFGASGRNGGWMMAALEGETRILQGLDGEQRRLAVEAIHSILPEVSAVLSRESIDCDFQQGGGLYAAARYPEQLRFNQQLLAEYRAVGLGEDDFRWLSPQEFSQRLHIRQCLGGIYTPHIARIHPAKLAQGLAAAVVGLGVDIFEQSAVTAIDKDCIETAQGRVRASRRVLAMEGFSYNLHAQRRRVLPVQSRIIATEVLSDSQWQDIGLAEREVFNDASPLVTYGQRSADNRMVFGGSYRYGGLPRSDFSGDSRAFEAIHRLLLDCLPQLQGVAITHRWGGTLGMPRSGLPHAVFDPVSGLATAGGYSGEGVGASNLMARTVVDLLLGRDSPLVQMPWAHRAHPNQVLRRWEPEPLRWLAYAAMQLVGSVEEAVYLKGHDSRTSRAVRRCSNWLASLRT